jgi:hypothetical protein
MPIQRSDLVLRTTWTRGLGRVIMAAMDLPLKPPLESPALPQRVAELFKLEPGLWAIPATFLAAALLDRLEVERGPVLCVSRLLVGIPCGGCGLTRAFVSLAHGQWQAALDYNLLSPLWMGWMGGWWLLAMARLMQRRPLPTTPRPLTGIAAVLLGLFWGARLVSFFGHSGWWQTMQRDAVWGWLTSWLFGG